MADNPLDICEYPLILSSRYFSLLRFSPANALEVPPKDKISRRSLAPRRQRNSGRCSHHGSIEFTVRLFLYAYLRQPSNVFPTAVTDWHLYTLNPSATSSDNVLSADPDLEGENEATSGSRDVGGGEDGADIDMQESHPPSATAVLSQPVIAPLATTATNSHSPVDLSRNTHPVSPAETSTPAIPATQGQDITAPDQPVLHKTPSRNNLLTTFNDLPTNARESGWMKSKKTLNYFREVYKMGKLSDLILHWYQLEEALGFQEVVSCSAN